MSGRKGSSICLGGQLATGRGKRRLSVQEVLSLDSKRRLVLLKRDGVEHLLLLGLNDDVVVETGIVPPAEQPAAEVGKRVGGEDDEQHRERDQLRVRIHAPQEDDVREAGDPRA